MTADVLTRAASRPASPLPPGFVTLGATVPAGSGGTLEATSTAVVDAALPLLVGHYPGFPIFPGVCLIECVHQTVVSASAEHGVRLRLTRLISTRFLAPAFPGDRLVTAVRLRTADDRWTFDGEVTCEGRQLAKVRLEYAPAARPSPITGPAERHTDDGAAMDAPELKAHLPHRFPMLLVDCVDEIRAGQSLLARKAVTGSEPWYADLPDGAPVDDYGYPPVLLVESWCQSAGVLATLDRPNPDVLDGDVMLFGSVADVEFGAPVLPGTALEHRVRLVREIGSTLVFGGESVADDQVVLRVGQIVMAMRPAHTLRPVSQDAHEKESPR